MVGSIRVYWKAYRDRHRGLSHEDDFVGNLTELQALEQNETVNKRTLQIEMDRIDTKINDYRDEVIHALKALRKDMEKNEENIIAQLRGN